MVDKNTTQHTLARQAIRALLDGSDQPDTAADYGPWAEAVAALTSAHDEGGTSAVRKAFNAVAKADPALVRLVASEPVPDTYNCTDLGNSERLAAWHGDDLRYCDPWGCWLAWDGKTTHAKSTGEPMRLCGRSTRRRAMRTTQTGGRPLPGGPAGANRSTGAGLWSAGRGPCCLSCPNRWTLTPGC